MFNKFQIKSFMFNKIFRTGVESINNILSTNCSILNLVKRTAKVAAIALTVTSVNSFAQGRYYTGDFHQHTTYSDGFYTIGYMMEMNNKFGLDWWANSEHGGAFNRWGLVSGKEFGFTTKVTWDNTGIPIKGKEVENYMWRWQSLSEWSFRDVLQNRRLYPNKIIIQGFEFNPPGHEHASVGLIGNQFHPTNPDVTALATFEYLFDAGQVATGTDDSQPFGITTPKNFVNDHKKCIEALTWLQTNYPNESWCIVAHPERFKYESGTPNYHGWNIEHFRDLNNVAPDVFFGFESLPGHQQGTNRCEYHKGRGDHGSVGTNTYGGAGIMCAKVGGLWDALLSEGRKFWLFANSDCHEAEIGDPDFFPGEYQKTYTYMTEFTAQGIVDGLRSGNTYCVHGDLIDTLQFKIGDAMMGQTHEASGNGNITISVRLRVPATNNNIYGGSNVPNLHHFDIIAGEVTHKVEPPTNYPADGKTGYSDAYKCDTVKTTRVVARFGKTAAGADPCDIATTAWTESGGFITASFNYTIPDGKKMYFRLRGTNQPLGKENKTDECGNPLIDTLDGGAGTNNGAKAFADLWFYTNPVYAANNFIGIAPPPDDADGVQVYPNPTSDVFYIEGADITKVSTYNAIGELVKTSKASENSFDITELPIGVYTLELTTNDGKVINKSIVKK